MHISCPKCHFKRNVDRKQIPAAAIMATCPKCENKFRFRDPETGDFLDEICSVFEDTSINTSQGSLQNSTQNTSSANETLSENKTELKNEESGQDEAQNHYSHSDSIKQEDVQKNEIDSSDSADTHIKDEESQQNQAGIDEERDSDSYIASDEDPKPLKEEDIISKYENEDRNNPLRPPQEDSLLNEKESEKYQMMTDDVPWEHPERYGVVASLVQTILRVMFRAPSFFSTIHSQSPAIRPITFYALLGFFQSFCLQVWISTFENVDVVLNNPVMQENLTQFSTPMTLIMSPFLAVFQLLLFSAFFYLAIRITNPEHADYNLIIRIIAYAYAPTVLSIVPYIGPLIGLVWFVFNIFIGVKYALRLTWQRTILALSPIFLLWLFIIGSSLSQYGM